MNLIWKSIPNSGSIKSKTITKLFNRFMNRRVELWNDKEIATTLAPGAIWTAVGRKIWSKILRKTCVKTLVNKCGCPEHHALFNRKPMQFLKHRSYTGVRLVFGTIVAALFLMHCNLHRLNLERLLESELQ